MGEKVKGNLIIIGGAEDKYGESEILKQVVKEISDKQGKLMVLTTATMEPEDVGKQYREVFSRLGVQEIDVLDINTRTEADSIENVERITSAGGIFFTGGDQLRITSILGGTKAYSALMDAYSKGTLVVGTSAGASVMCSTMIVNGKSNDAARKCTLKMAPGLGLIEETIIDQHFEQRGRIGRLLSGVAENPFILGIGIDENTAIRVYPDAHFEVLGANAVTIVDGQTIKSSNVSELKPDEILAITNVTLHVLPTGYGFDLMKREVMRIKKDMQN